MKSDKYLTRCQKLATKMMNNGIVNTLKEEFSNAHGAVTMSRLAFEAIGALILVIILILVPRLGAAIEDGMPAISDNSSWAGAADGGAMWAQLEPMFTVAALVIIIGMVIRVVYGLRDAGN